MKHTALLLVANFCAGALVVALTRPATASDDVAYLLMETARRVR